MSSAECSMGLRSFLIHPDDNKNYNNKINNNKTNVNKDIHQIKNFNEFSQQLSLKFIPLSSSTAICSKIIHKPMNFKNIINKNDNNNNAVNNLIIVTKNDESELKSLNNFTEKYDNYNKNYEKKNIDSEINILSNVQLNQSADCNYTDDCDQNINRSNVFIKSNEKELLAYQTNEIFNDNNNFEQKLCDFNTNKTSLIKNKSMKLEAYLNIDASKNVNIISLNNNQKNLLTKRTIGYHKAASPTNMKASTSSIMQNRCYSTIDGNSHQNGYIKNATNLNKLNDVESKNIMHNQYTSNYYNQNQQTSIQTFSFKKNSIKLQTKSVMQSNNNNTNNNDNDIPLTLSTPTKGNEEYYTELIKPSPILSILNNNKDSCCVSSTINNDTTLTDIKTMPFCIQQLQQSVNNQQKSSFFNRNNQDYIYNRYKSTQSIQNLIATSTCDNENNNKINENDSLALDREELRRRIVTANNNSDEENYEKNNSKFNQQKKDKVRQPIEPEDADIDAEVSEALFRSFNLPKNFRSNMPTKYHVLSYIANTNGPLYIRRTGSELQVTDIDGFPLLDVWLKTSCFRPTTWMLEAYGAAVLLFTVVNCKKTNNRNGFWRGQRQPYKQHSQQKNASQTQQSTLSNLQQHQQQTIKVFNNSSLVTSPSVLHVQEPEGETLGYIIADDSFIIQNREQKSIAKIVSSYGYENHSKGASIPSLKGVQKHSVSTSTYSQLLRVYQCILDSNKQEIGRLEVNESQLSLMQLCFGNSALHTNDNKSLILNGSSNDKHQNNDNNELTLSIKLLVLASAIRLTAAISSTSSTKKTNNQKGQNCKSNSTALAVGTTNSSDNCCTIV